VRRSAGAVGSPWGRVSLLIRVTSAWREERLTGGIQGRLDDASPSISRLFVTRFAEDVISRTAFWRRPWGDGYQRRLH
jgi:hypothetical protein